MLADGTGGGSEDTIKHINSWQCYSVYIGTSCPEMKVTQSIVAWL